MKTNFERVREFRVKFGLPLPELSGAHLDVEAFLLRLDLMLEELHETLRAYRKGNLPAFADGLADLLYMVYGTAAEAGIPIDEVFAEVHDANMRKIRAVDTNNARGSTSDIVKPEGWQPADVGEVLRRNGWRQR